MKLPSNEAQIARDKLREDLKRANELLAQIRTEVRVLESRRNGIRQDIDAESAALKHKRELELADLVSQAEAAIEPLKNEKAQLNVDIAGLIREHQKLDSEQMGLETQTAAERATLGMVKRELEDAQAQRQAAENAVAGISAQITNLSSQIQPMRDELALLTGEVRDATSRRDEVEKAIPSLQAEYHEQKAKIKLDIDGLERKRRELATGLNAERQEMERAREDLSKWELTLGKKDKILRAREYRVTQDEAKIADNVGLLNL